MGSWNQQPQQETPAAAQADDLPAEPAPQQAAASQSAVAQTERTERLTSSQTKTKLKSFFNGILQAVKEEKEELQREIASVAPASEPSAAAPQSDDLLDAVLKKSEQAAPSHPKETPAVQTTASDAVVPSAEVTFSGKTAADILDLDVDAVFAEIGLQEHLSPSRRNGLEAMLEKIRYYAKNLG